MPTVGVAPGTFTIALGNTPNIPLNVCPNDPWGTHFAPYTPEGDSVIPDPTTQVVAGGRVTVRSPYASEAELMGLRDTTVLGVRKNLFGVVIGSILAVGLTIGLLASK